MLDSSVVASLIYRVCNNQTWGTRIHQWQKLARTVPTRANEI